MIGFHCYDGHNHEPDREKRETEGTAIYTSILTVLQSLGPLHSRDSHLCWVVLRRSVMQVSRDRSVTGTCFLQDWNYLNYYKDLDFLPAALVFSRVIGGYKSESLFTLDLGYKGIASDPKGERGKILNGESSHPLFQNEEHWVFKSDSGTIPKIGEPMYVLPAHICPTCALYDEAVVVDAEGNMIDRWEIIARKRELTI